jgi:hypothetical protein
MYWALSALGMSFAVPFDGLGDGAMREALEAVAHHLGVENFMIVKAHG